jgi:hypothetical protein
VRDDGNRAIYLTDGYINLAILPARGGREGIDHFGFQVDEMEHTLAAAGRRAKGEKREKSRATGASPNGRARSAGTPVDVSVKGWKASARRRRSRSRSGRTGSGRIFFFSL